MQYKLPTRFEEFTLMIRVRTPKSEKIHLKVYDEQLRNTVFTNRWKTVDGECTFYVRMPVSGQTSVIDIYNDKYGNNSQGDGTFEVIEIKKIPLEKRMDVLDFSNGNLRGFINFCTRFCFNAGHLISGNYRSSDGKFSIEYLPTIISSKSGKELETPARISKDTGKIQVSQKKFVPDTIPMRMAIMLHEYSHYYVNEDIDNESEADLNGLLIYLGLGYPRFEGHEAFLKTFINTPSHQNKERYDKIKKFIDDFEKNNYIIYE
jgi:hypothetical protein